jgi:hypothetical protein
LVVGRVDLFSLLFSAHATGDEALVPRAYSTTQWPVSFFATGSKSQGQDEVLAGWIDSTFDSRCPDFSRLFSFCCLHTLPPPTSLPEVVQRSRVGSRWIARREGPHVLMGRDLDAARRSVPSAMRWEGIDPHRRRYSAVLIFLSRHAHSSGAYRALFHSQWGHDPIGPIPQHGP